MGKQRIEYIDAMRGFTMILVVYSHVCSMCLGDSWMGYNDVFFLFRLPCFFFISGWLFNPLKGTFGSVTKHKFMVQIVPTLIFLLLLAPPPMFFSKLGATKGGYWFTFVLFEFFIVSMLSTRFCKKWGLLIAVFISVSSFFYDAYYNRFFVQLSWMKDIVGFLSFKTWRFYLFFYMGILVKRHFDVFLQLTSKRYMIIILLACFVIMAYLPHYENVTVSYLIFAIGGMSGMIIIFTFFRYVGLIMSSHPNSYLLPLNIHRYRIFPAYIYLLRCTLRADFLQ